ncbi:hypothetical protein B0H11DRAFT_2196053 [Mycena galericulata]|nr:hypothetical protein B0H11DRAFT_2196053 [Mycena galericulata]
MTPGAKTEALENQVPTRVAVVPHSCLVTGGVYLLVVHDQPSSNLLPANYAEIANSLSHILLTTDQPENFHLPKFPSSVAGVYWRMFFGRRRGSRRPVLSHETKLAMGIYYNSLATRSCHAMRPPPPIIQFVLPAFSRISPSTFLGRVSRFGSSNLWFTDSSPSWCSTPGSILQDARLTLCFRFLGIPCQLGRLISDIGLSNGSGTLGDRKEQWEAVGIFDNNSFEKFKAGPNALTLGVKNHSAEEFPALRLSAPAGSFSSVCERAWFQPRMNERELVCLFALVPRDGWPRLEEKLPPRKAFCLQLLAQELCKRPISEPAGPWSQRISVLDLSSSDEST